MTTCHKVSARIHGHMGHGYVLPAAVHMLRRPRLQATMDQPWQVLQVQGGPGFGKTALVSQWACEQSFPVCWLSATPRDNAPGAWQHRLDEAVAGLAPNAVLVIDDADVLLAPDAWGALEALVGWCRLIVISRAATSFQFSRLRSQGGVRAILTDDLRFTLRETYTLLETLWQTRLSRDQARAVWTMTRGWVAGLAFVWSVERHIQGTLEFGVREWRTWDQMLDQYFDEEVVRPLPADLQHVLLRTADLPFLDVDSGVGELDFATLRRLVAHVSMLEADELRPDRYRLDPLMAASLRRLARDRVPGEWAARSRDEDVHRLLASGEYRAAADLALRTGDMVLGRQALRHLGAYLSSMSLHGEMIMWFDQAPDQVVRGDPDLDYWWLIARLGLGRTFGVAERIREVEPAWMATGEPLLAGRLLLVRGVYAYHLGQGEESTRLLAAAREQLPPDAEMEHLYEQTFAGRQFVRDGRDDLAREPLVAAELTLRQQPIGATWGWRTVAADRANSYALRGDLHSAMTKYRLMLSELPGHVPDIEGFLHCRLLALELERDLLPDAADRLERIDDLLGMDGLQWHNDPSIARVQAMLAGHHRLDVIDWRHDAAIARLRLMLAQGDLEHAEHWGAGYLKLVRHMPQKEQIVLMLAYLWLERGEWSMVESWLLDIGSLHWPWVKFFGDIDPQVLAIDLELARGNPAAALRRANAFVTEAAARLRWSEYVAGSMRLAVARDMAGDGAGAREAVGQAARIGFRGGFVRSFQVPGWDVSERYRAVWAEHGHPAGPFAIDHGLGGVDDAEVGMLTQREAEVLGLVAEGLSNKQIATRLFISVNTVRNHLVRMSRRLEASSRTELVARARALGLLA